MSEYAIVSPTPIPLYPASLSFKESTADLGSWYAAYVRSHFEKRASDELAGKGLASYVPVLRELHRWKDRQKTVEVPLFPGYVFFRVQDLAESRLRVLNTAGVVRILGSSQSAEVIPASEIEAVNRLLSAQVALSTHPLIQEGCLVRVCRGPLCGLEGRFIRIKNSARLVISVVMLSQSVLTEIDAHDVIPLSVARMKQ